MGGKIRKCILNKQWMWLGRSGQGLMVGSCEGGNK
jgi:hypothetical protein